VFVVEERTFEFEVYEVSREADVLWFIQEVEKRELRLLYRDIIVS